MDKFNLLLGTEASYYTGKVRPYLVQRAIPFQEILSSLEVYRGIILPGTGVAFIPVLVHGPRAILERIRDDQQLPEGWQNIGVKVIQDSTEIIDFLEKEYPPTQHIPAAMQTTPKLQLITYLFEIYSMEYLVIPAMHYRWSFPEQYRYAYYEFGRTSLPNATFAEQVEAGEKLSGPFSGSIRNLGVTPESVAAIEHNTHELFAALQAHFEQHAFLLGGRPTVADYNLMAPLYAHLWRDPVPYRLMRCNYPLVSEWVERVNGRLNTRCQLDAHGYITGKLFEENAIPETLVNLLRLIVRHFAPFLSTSTNTFTEWAKEHTQQHEVAVPRAVGFKKIRIHNVEVQRAVFTHALWLQQRLHSFYHHQCSNERQKSLNDLIESIGAVSWITTLPSYVLSRKNNRLFLLNQHAKL